MWTHNESNIKLLQLLSVALHLTFCIGQSTYCDEPYECSNMVTQTTSISVRGYKGAYGSSTILISGNSNTMDGSYAGQYALKMESTDQEYCRGENSVSC